MLKRTSTVVLVGVLLVGFSVGAVAQLRLRLGIVQAQASELSSGDIVIRASGTCGTGFTEVSGLDGKFLIGTLAANGNIGGTGGSDNITPAGTNDAPTLTMNAYTPAGTNAGGAVDAHSGTAVADHASHTHTYTDVVNHVHVQAVNSATTGGLSGYTPDTSSNTSATSGYSTANPTGGVASGTTNGPSATLTHSVTQPSAHTFTQPTFTGTQATLTGSVAAPTFTGTQFDNRPAFARVIFCAKN